MAEATDAQASTETAVLNPEPVKIISSELAPRNPDVEAFWKDLPPLSEVSEDPSIPLDMKNLQAKSLLGLWQRGGLDHLRTAVDKESPEIARVYEIGKPLRTFLHNQPGNKDGRVLVFRGGIEDNSAPQKVQSYTFDPDQAAIFTNNGKPDAAQIASIRVPIDDIMTYLKTGLGFDSQLEVIVIDRRQISEAMRKSLSDALQGEDLEAIKARMNGLS